MSQFKSCSSTPGDDSRQTACVPGFKIPQSASGIGRDRSKLPMAALIAEFRSHFVCNLGEDNRSSGTVSGHALSCEVQVVRQINPGH